MKIDKSEANGLWQLTKTIAVEMATIKFRVVASSWADGNVDGIFMAPTQGELAYLYNELSKLKGESEPSQAE